MSDVVSFKNDKLKTREPPNERKEELDEYNGIGKNWDNLMPWRHTHNIVKGNGSRPTLCNLVNKASVLSNISWQEYDLTEGITQWLLLQLSREDLNDKTHHCLTQTHNLRTLKRINNYLTTPPVYNSQAWYVGQSKVRSFFQPNNMKSERRANKSRTNWTPLKGTESNEKEYLRTTIELRQQVDKYLRYIPRKFKSST